MSGIHRTPFNTIARRRGNGKGPEAVSPLELTILRGEFAEGDTVRVDACEGGIVFEKA
jgi:hypothetical protein